MNRILAAGLFAALSSTAIARAEPPPPPPPAEPPPVAEPAPPQKPAPYSLPWQLRPAAASTGVRSDTSFAFFNDATTGNGTTTVASLLTGSYQVVPDLAVFLRAAVVGTPKAFAVVNPLAGAVYVLKLPEGFRIGTSLALTAPVGMGGGDPTKDATAAAVKSGMLARAAMDNVLFSVNDFSIVPGIDVAWVAHGVTVQLEATLLGLIKTRGKQPDAGKLNFTSGLHAGYFIIPQLSLGADLRYQRWLSTPAPVAADPTGALRDTMTFAVGPRGNFQLGKSAWFRPGVSYGRGLDKPMSAQAYNLVQLDLPFTF